MEYEFIHDPITGSAKAKFSMEHEVIGPWLEVEVGHNTEKLTELLTALSKRSDRQKNDILVTGQEYSVVFSEEDVTIQTNASLNGVQSLPDELVAEQLDFDQNNVASCGIEDFKVLLHSWATFIKS
ncbi:MAG: YacL family protein [Colwellia sp.]|nr:YacL family protein [Colwellia sp.]